MFISYDLPMDVYILTPRIANSKATDLRIAYGIGIVFDKLNAWRVSNTFVKSVSKPPSNATPSTTLKILHPTIFVTRFLAPFPPRTGRPRSPWVFTADARLGTPASRPRNNKPGSK
jgi:hypothetical protein